jgi:2-methylisocitrate lyase-like PEP mutase family enzyme
MDKGKVFRALHDSTFVIPNPWDIGTAKLLAHAGFKALATTSAGYAFSRGLADGAVEFDEMIQHCKELVHATDLPVSADLENGKGDSAESAAETIFAAEAAGLAGCSIEDFSGDAIYDFDLAVARVKAAADAARSLKRDFVFTARAENFLRGRNDLDDTIKRLQAFSDVGADVLYAPGIADIEVVRKITSAVNKPVNVLIVPGFTVASLRDAGAAMPFAKLQGMFSVKA